VLFRSSSVECPAMPAALLGSRRRTLSAEPLDAVPIKGCTPTASVIQTIKLIDAFGFQYTEDPTVVLRGPSAATW